MAFCPHCGKSATDQAVKCIGCGKELEPLQKKSGGKFKGTMMMAAPGADLKAPAAPAPAPAPAPVAAPAPAPEPEPAAAAAPAAKKASIGGATMIGTGLPLGGMVGQPQAAALAAPAPSGASPAPTPVPPADDGAASAPPEADGDQQMLAGDPMSDSGPTSLEPSIARAKKPSIAPAGNTVMWVMVGFGGMLLIGAVGYGAAVFLGLL